MKNIWFLLLCIGFTLRQVTAHCGPGLYCYYWTADPSVCLCAACPSGKYKSNTCASDPPVYDNCRKQNVCLGQECRAGTYGPLRAQTAAQAQCLNCLAGTHSWQNGACHRIRRCCHVAI
jgi:hypothetical protein